MRVKGGDSTDPPPAKENLPLADDSPRMLSISYVKPSRGIELAETELGSLIDLGCCQVSPQKRAATWEMR